MNKKQEFKDLANMILECNSDTFHIISICATEVEELICHLQINYFQVSIGMCDSCFRDHFCTITSSQNIHQRMRYVDRERRKRKLPIFQFKRDPEGVTTIPQYQSVFGLNK